MVKQFTEPTDRINVSLPRDMLAAMRLTQRNEGVPLSRQVRMAMTEWLMDRAAAKVREDAPLDPVDEEAAELNRAGYDPGYSYDPGGGGP